MPRSFLIKKHQSTKKTNCGRLKSKTEGKARHYFILSESESNYWSRYATQTRNLILVIGAQQPTESYTQMDLKFQYVVGNHMRRKSLLPQSLPFLALFPATPPGDSSRESFECLEYHKEYLSFSGMAMHKQRQCAWSSKKFFSCKYCEKEYISLGALKMHIRTHTLPCVCKLCGKAFSRPWLLQGHIRTHTGEKPFSCLHCSRAFADRSNLRAHLQTHSEVKKYQCGSCFKTFSRISLLCKHQETLCPLV
uniref:Zinc finger protein SNAI2 n=1 Tax=Amphilophus citrinellus TaxID=61819 RepID=A0A3Q0SUW4_AMPCI